MADTQPGSSADGLGSVGRIIAIGSGKGGVGKSTVSVNLALALVEAGCRVGLVDADIHGPSIPGMLGMSGVSKPSVGPDKRVIPAEAGGLKVMSMGMLTGDDTPAVLRGPMVTKYLRLFIADVAWGELDYLLLDLPPGTGDVQLTLAQSFPLSGAVVVTTPQDVSLRIAQRGLRMFEQVKVPILGIVENMSGFACPHCGGVTHVFSEGGGARMSRDLGVPYLGSIPLDAGVVESGDAGRPILRDRPGSRPAIAYREIAAALLGEGAVRAPAGVGSFAWDWETGAGAPPAHDAAGGGATTPVSIVKRDARTLSFVWGDGAEHVIDVRDLRLACACAACVDENSGRAILDPAQVPRDVAPIRLASVGNYALTVSWTDGHDTGIYPFASLRKLGERTGAEAAEDV